MAAICIGLNVLRMDQCIYLFLHFQSLQWLWYHPVDFNNNYDHSIEESLAMLWAPVNNMDK